MRDRRVVLAISRLLFLAILVIPTWYAVAKEDTPPTDERPTHVEVEPIQIELGPDGKIVTLAMSGDGNLLVGVSWSTNKGASSAPVRRRGRPSRGRGRAESSADREYAIKVVSPNGKLLQTKPMGKIVPQMIHGCENGDVYVFGSHQIVRFDKKGKQIASLPMADVLEGYYADWHSSGITANENYVFVALGDGFSLRATEDVVRFSRKLTEPKLIAEQLYGCCSHIDLDVKDNVLLVAENSRHRVKRFSLDGEKLDTWGSRSRTAIEGFAACCNPVNFDFGPDGVLYTAESGIGRIKKYTADGEYLGLVGYVDTTDFDRASHLAAMSCYIPVEVSADGKRIYVQDVRANIIRVLEEKP